MKRFASVLFALCAAACGGSSASVAPGYNAGDYHVVGVMVYPSPAIQQLSADQQAFAQADVAAFSKEATPMLTQDLGKLGVGKKPVWLYVEVQEMDTQLNPDRMIFIGNQVTISTSVTLVDASTKAIVATGRVETSAGNQNGVVSSLATSFAKATPEEYMRLLAKNYDEAVIEELYPN